MNRFFFINKKFSCLDELELNNENIKGIIFDLGYSSTQIKDTKKGLSFNSHGSLNMKMGLNEFSAEDVIHRLDKDELVKIFKFFGDEKDSKKIASKIVKNREIKKIDTQGLVKIIETSKKRKIIKHILQLKFFNH